MSGGEDCECLHGAASAVYETSGAMRYDDDRIRECTKDLVDLCIYIRTF
jgi:hypothetical protein